MIPATGHDRFAALVDAARSFVLVSHLNPDGDAVGSLCSLGHYLQSLGKSVRIVNSDAAPEILRFVEAEGPRVEAYRPQTHDPVLEQADLLVLVDNSAPDRLGRMEGPMVQRADRTLCIDHHPTREVPWAHNIVDVGACATTEMIYELVTARGYRPEGDAALAIYVGLATDTGFFRFNSTTDRAHDIAAELIRRGVAPARVYGEVYERNSVAFTRLLGHALAGLRLDAGGSVASVKITHQLIEALQAEDEDTAEITTALLAMDRVRIAVLFRELPDGRIKVSLRSKGALDVHKLAIEYGGGGHLNASGIVMAGGLDQVVRTITARAMKLVQAGASR